MVFWGIFATTHAFVSWSRTKITTVTMNGKALDTFASGFIVVTIIL